MTLTIDHPSLRERQDTAGPPGASRLMIEALREAQREAQREQREAQLAEFAERAARAARPAAAARVEERLDTRHRNARGHCVDGQICDHPDHGPGVAGEGIIHYFL
jgi:hypothetical protein